MKYAVGIPTRDRPELLQRTLEAFSIQTVPPSAVYVVNNNSGVAPDLGSTGAVLVANPYEVAGPEQGHECALEIIRACGYEIAVRWDDDLVPEPECMERLLRLLHDGSAISAVGGCYPRPEPDWPVWPGGPDSRTPTPCGHPGRAQFYRWDWPDGTTPRPRPARHLYSGMAYRVSAATAVGGFCTAYSQIGYRAETDFSLRLGLCCVEPAAIALHHKAAGGIRTVANRDYERMARADERLFRARMTERGIDLGGGYWQ